MLSLPSLVVRFIQHSSVLVDALEKDSLDGLREYTADNLLDFLSRQTDKDLMADLVKGLDTE